MRMIGRVLILATLMIIFAPYLAHSADGAATANPCQGCKIVLLSPGPGAALNNQSTVQGSFIVSFFVSNFTLVQPGTHNDVNTCCNAAGQNEGHIHVFVDDRYVEIWTSSNGIPLTLPSGSHTVKLELVNDLHESFNPAISTSTTLNVINGSDSIQSAAGNAQTYSLGALIAAVIALILAGLAAFRPRTSIRRTTTP